MLSDLQIHRDIRRARTLPGDFYSDADTFSRCRDIFAQSWQFIGHLRDVQTPGTVVPAHLLPSFLDEPLLLVRDLDDGVHCMSNVCTHRGVVLVEGRCHAKTLRCRYHGRRFDLAGRCLGMPEFENVVGFPSADDNLPKLPLGNWADLLFTHLGSQADFSSFVQPLEEHLHGLDFRGVQPDPQRSRDYQVRANWALYCDNYLESFHVPFVHKSLARVLDYQQIDTVLFPGGSLQLGAASDENEAFELPSGSPYAGRRIAAFYVFLFPNLMLNFYPWGLSLNLVEPQAIDRTRVRFRSFVLHPDKLDQGAGSDLDRVEREDEAVVESAQLGTRSRLYRQGRYSPTQELAVHHFHRQLAAGLKPAGCYSV